MRDLAPRWHTAALIFLMLAVAATGTALGRHVERRDASSAPRIVGVYLPLLLAEWTLTLYVCRIGLSRNVLPALLRRGRYDLRRASVDAVLAAAGWFVIEGSEAVFARWGSGPNAAVWAILPHGGAERVVWALVAVSAGFCEEVVYRGYLQIQLSAWTRRPMVAIGVQAALFGVAHGEQGLATALRFAVYGVGFGLLARWRQSLVPGIACHVGIDLASGLLAP